MKRDVEEVEHVLELNQLLARNDRLGVTIEYGQGKDGYDQWVIVEPNGGGSVTVPYVWIQGELYVGVQKQQRNLNGPGFTTEVPRGLSQVGETHARAAGRETAEETGVDKSLVMRIQPLGTRSTSPNTAHYKTDTRHGQGVHYFQLPLYPEDVQVRHSGNTPLTTVYTLQPSLQGEIREVNEKINPAGLRFLHWSLLSQTDAFTSVGIIRILAAQKKQELLKQNRKEAQ